MSKNITKDGIQVEIGQIWHNCDKRHNGNVVIKEVGDGRVRIMTYTSDGRHYPPLRWLSVRRMHQHSTGHMFVKDLP